MNAIHADVPDLASSTIGWSTSALIEPSRCGRGHRVAESRRVGPALKEKSGDPRWTA